MKILVISGSVWAAEGANIEAIIKNAGHEIVTDTKTNVTTFVTTLEKDFPDIYAAIKDGIATLKDSTLSGGDKALKVATDVVAVLPAVLKDLPGIKDAVMAAVTVAFAQEVSDFKTVTAETITAIGADVVAGVAGTTASVGTTASTNTSTAAG